MIMKMMIIMAAFFDFHNLEVLHLQYSNNNSRNAVSHALKKFCLKQKGKVNVAIRYCKHI